MAQLYLTRARSASSSGRATVVFMEVGDSVDLSERRRPFSVSLEAVTTAELQLTPDRSALVELEGALEASPLLSVIEA